MSHYPWWRGAVIYQIYPRSYLDANGDGVGDLPGIIQRLDHIAALGVDAIWISPFFRSPMADFGYDIADYRDVDPLFGSLDDFDRLLAKAHGLGLKVMIDQVLSHTSIEHAWFRESRQTAAIRRPTGTSGPTRARTAPAQQLAVAVRRRAWQWEPRREQYYLHNFLVDQPDLNFHHPDVQQATLDNVRFWLDRGVDGFRLDAINFCFHDAQLRDNPPSLPTSGWARLQPGQPVRLPVPLLQQHAAGEPAVPGAPARAAGRIPGAVSLGEISSEDSLATTAEYTRDGRLHMGYSFELLVDDYSAAYIRDTVSRLEAAMTEGWPCWAVSNHDVERAVSRWGGHPADPRLARMLVAMLCSLRGSVCLYQGEELGLAEAEVPFEALQDPYGITFWPNFKGRDGCRTPLPWTDAPLAGFTTGQPWLPIPAEHRAAAVAVQERDPHSVLAAFRAFWPGGIPSRPSCMAASDFLKAPSPCCCSSVCLQMKPSCWPSTCRPKR
jgi:alpha-glucosidase